MGRLSVRGSMFTWHGTPAEKDKPKSAGFRWNPQAKFWWTTDINRAASLVKYADEKAKAKLAGEPGAGVDLGFDVKLTYDGTKYVAEAGSKKGIAELRAAAFQVAGKKFTTRDTYFAAKLARYADPETRMLIEQREALRLALLQKSRAQDSTYPIPCPAGREFYPFQRAGIEYAAERLLDEVAAALIADEMGLGKTPQGCGVINVLAQKLRERGEELKNVLVICPLQVKFNWRRELKNWVVERNLIVRLVSAQHWPLPHGMLERDAGQIVVIHPHVLHKWKHRLDAIEWDLILIDEAHTFLSLTARWTRMLMGYTEEVVDPVTHVKMKVKHPGIPAKRKLALTGTPIKNRTRELFTLLNYLDPRGWHSKSEYTKRYSAAGFNDEGRWDDTGASNLAELQERLRGSIMVRREMSQVMPELPPLTRQLIELELPEVVKAEANMLLDLGMSREQYIEWKAGADVTDAIAGVEQISTLEARAGSREIGAENKMRRLAGLAVVPAAIEICKDITDDHKLLAFFHHREVGEKIQAHFGQKMCGLIYGGMTPEQKQGVQERAWHDPECKLVLMSITMAVGVNLQCMWHMLFIEPDYVPGIMDQAAGRCRRIGQANDHVLAQYLAPQGSILSDILRIQWEKAAVIREALDQVQEGLFV
jgi:SWI/SNF-related matrix-associated actin-dependent regulator of chromatin subfamily A-like protein 1